MSRVLRASAAAFMLSERSNILTSTEKPTTSKADPTDRGPHRTQARRPRVPCDICPQYGIICTLKIPAVSSGATWTLQLRNFLRTCITQGPEYFRHPFVKSFGVKFCKFVGNSYPYCRFILIFHQIGLIFPPVPTVSSCQVLNIHPQLHEQESWCESHHFQLP